MSKKNRWISRELGHLNDHMALMKIDMKSGNTASALTNWGLAMGIIKAMIERDSKSIRSIEKAGHIIKSLHKALKPLLKEAGKEALKAYLKKGGIK